MITIGALKWSVERKWITGAFCLALLLMGLVNLISYQNATQLINSAAQVKQTNEVLTALTRVSEMLTDSEAQRWRYLLLSNRDELDNYNQAMQSLNSQLERLRQIMSDTPLQGQRLDTLEALIQQRQILFEQSTVLQQVARLSSDASIITQINQNRTQLRLMIVELQFEEEQLLEQQVEQSQANSQVRMTIENLGTILAFAGLLGVYVLLYRQMFKRQQLEEIRRRLAQDKELSELKLQFFSMVSHEFRTPLSVIVGSAQLLHENLRSLVDPSRLKNLFQIQASAKLMTQLLNDILTLARADAGKLECKPELIEIQFFCLNLIEDIQLFSDQPRTIRFHKHGARTYAYLDEKLIYSVLSNLLSNAIKYSAPETAIDFTVICDSDVVTFEVKDQGIGIPEDEQPKIFEPFCRGRNVGSATGSGLGMAIVKRCMDIHQGDLVLHSQVGVGSVFTVRIKQPHRIGFQ